jgi:hypothetical protein
LFLALLGGWLVTIDKGIEASEENSVPETFHLITAASPYIFKTANEGLPMSSNSGCKPAAMTRSVKPALRHIAVIINISQP